MILLLEPQMLLINSISAEMKDFTFAETRLYIYHAHAFLILPYEMGRHYVFMRILKIFNLSEIFYISGWVTMSTLQIQNVRLSPDKTNFISKSYNLIFEIYAYLN